MIDSILSILGNSASIYGAISAVKTGKYADEIINKLDTINKTIVQLDDKIMYCDELVIKDISKTKQDVIDQRREIRMHLEPVQRATKEKILSSSLIFTPDKLKKAMNANPWQVLIDVRPLTYSTPHSNPDMVPIMFEEGGIAYIGWQLKGTIPMLFDCEYKPDLWVVNSRMKDTGQKIRRSYARTKNPHAYSVKKEKLTPKSSTLSCGSWKEKLIQTHRYTYVVNDKWILSLDKSTPEIAKKSNDSKRILFHYIRNKMGGDYKDFFTYDTSGNLLFNTSDILEAAVIFHCFLKNGYKLPLKRWGCKENRTFTDSYCVYWRDSATTAKMIDNDLLEWVPIAPYV